MIQKLIDKLKEMKKFLSELVTSWDMEAGAEVEEPVEFEEETEAPPEEGGVGEDEDDKGIVDPY